MARIRSIKPGFCTSEAISVLTERAELHFIKLWTYADDEGRGLDNPRLIKAACWPLRDVVSTDVVAELQAELAEKGRIRRYVVDGTAYFQVLNFSEHQHPQKPSKSVYPPEPSRKRPGKARTSTRPLRDRSRTDLGEVAPVVGGGVGGVEGEGTILSSTSDSRPPQAEPVREEGVQPKNRRSDAVCDAAFAWLARYDLERVNGNGKVRNPDAWLTQAAQNRRSRHQADAERLIAEHPEWTPEQLAKAVAARDGNGAPGESTVAAAWERAKRNEAERCPIHGRLAPDEPVPNCDRCRAVVGVTT